ncbi:MAG: hypothetical protein INQ03_04790 [Candidatus Heimdallarchaeota archaeon]|nr:hypothetical protein [Candidatus Heimdallarchaeota archaeon]
MTSELISDASLDKLEGDVIRAKISEKVRQVKKDFRLLHYEFTRFNENLASKLEVQWKKEEINKGERASARLSRWREMAKYYRSQALAELSDFWYDRFWLMRSEVALITSIYELSGLKTIPEFMKKWEPKEFPELKPLVMRMGGPRKPKGKKFGVSDLSYDINAAYLQMIKPLEDWLLETAKLVENLKEVKKKQTVATKIKRYQESLYVREYLTVLCQAVAPRQSSYTDNQKK